MQLSKSLRIGASAIAILLAVGYVGLQSNGRQPASAPQQPRPQTAMPLPKSAAASDTGTTIRIVVKPDSNAAPGVYRFHKNDNVKFLISVPYDGMLAIHGYTNDNPIMANQQFELTLTLQHTGRFPIHVHGKDGQHIEVAVLEILPD